MAEEPQDDATGVPAEAAAGAPVAPRPSRRGRTLAIFAPLALAWLAADLATKAWANSFAVGDVIGGPYLGLVRFRLAHNTGGAWGMFGDATVALGVLSVVVCTALLAYLIVVARRASALEAVGVALVWAGGIGNAIDRFALGYVVDFIDLVFIDFPTFNVADIGVTCGFVLFFVGLALQAHRADAAAPGAGDDAGAGRDA
ncbi:MAG: signal peptidase II [Eggerthellaceae bacterium]|nr:signal peptidase II [Eggerthellaceae bacterium]